MLGLAIPYTWSWWSSRTKRKAVNKGVYGSYWDCPVWGAYGALYWAASLIDLMGILIICSQVRDLGTGERKGIQ